MGRTRWGLAAGAVVVASVRLPVAIQAGRGGVWPLGMWLRRQFGYQWQFRLDAVGFGGQRGTGVRPRAGQHRAGRVWWGVGDGRPPSRRPAPRRPGLAGSGGRVSVLAPASTTPAGFGGQRGTGVRPRAGQHRAGRVCRERGTGIIIGWAMMGWAFVFGNAGRRGWYCQLARIYAIR